MLNITDDKSDKLMNKLLPFLILCSLIVFNSGCSVTSNKYTVSTDNIDKLRKGGTSKVNVAKFTADPKKQAEIDGLTIRGASFASPYNGSYAEYLQTALQDELSIANRLDSNSQISISGVVLDNQFDASGVDLGEASLSARIRVTKSGNEKYNKVLTTKHTWESYFAAFKAVPAAQIGYVGMIQKFLGQLYSDKDFINAIK